MSRKLLFTCLFLSLVNSFLLALELSRDEQPVPSTENALPPSDGDKKLKSVSLRAFCPTPGDQGFTGTCNSWAAAYGAFTISRAIKKNLKETEAINKIATSALYVHSQLANDCKNPVGIIEVLDFMKDKGSCLYSTFDQYNSPCSRPPSAFAEIQASKFKIRNYNKLFADENLSKEKKRDTLLNALNCRNPVIAGIRFPRAFQEIKDDKIWSYERDLSPMSTETHAVVIIGYGYDAKLEYIELMNSWGVDSWGDKGFARISLSTFLKMIDFAYVLEQHSVNAALTSFQLYSFRFRKLIDASISWFFRDNSYYEINRKLRPGSQFQLRLEISPKHGYLYLLSIEPDGVIKCHRPDTIKDKLENIIIRPEVTQSKLIYVPYRWGSLKLNKKGTETLCFLFSPFPIEDIETKIEELTQVQGSVQKRLVKVFNKDLLPFSTIGYSLGSNNCGFEVENFNGIIPLIIKISTPD